MAATATKTAPKTETAPAETTPAEQPATPQNPESTVPTVVQRFDATTLTKIKSAPAWRPKDGDTLTGKIVAVIKRTGEFGPYPCVILDNGSDKFVADHAFHGVLQNEMKEMGAKAGDEITILYTGKRTANRLNADGSEKKYHGYSVVPTDGAEIEVFEF